MFSRVLKIGIEYLLKILIKKKKSFLLTWGLQKRNFVHNDGVDGVNF